MNAQGNMINYRPFFEWLIANRISSMHYTLT